MQTTVDKVVGLKDEVIGKVTKNPAKVEHGKEQRSGELKRKQADAQAVSCYMHAS